MIAISLMSENTEVKFQDNVKCLRMRVEKHFPFLSKLPPDGHSKCKLLWSALTYFHSSYLLLLFYHPVNFLPFL